MRKLKVLSLFDGIAVARQALSMIGYDRVEYYGAEIDADAVRVSTARWPDMVHLGDVCAITKKRYPRLFTGDVDLLIGGSPCQDLSSARGARKGLEGKKSRLFWEFARILREVQPRWFVLENVASMNESSKDAMSRAIAGAYWGRGENSPSGFFAEGFSLKPYRLNSHSVSAQNRDRLWWSNIGGVPGLDHDDEKITYQSILMNGVAATEKSSCLLAFEFADSWLVRFWKALQDGFYQPSSRSVCKTKGKIPLTGKNDFAYHLLREYVYAEPINASLPRTAIFDFIKELHYQADRNRANVVSMLPRLRRGGDLAFKGWKGMPFRKRAAVECERLQSLPDGYTRLPGLTQKQRRTVLGNAFNARVVAHLLEHMKNNEVIVPQKLIVA